LFVSGMTSENIICKLMLIIIIIIISTKLRDNKKQPYCALHTYYGKC
jgi:hypothetical protein